MNKQEFIPALKDIIVKAGEIALDVRQKNLVVNYKSDHSPVTNADKAVSAFIAQNITQLAPNIALVCEEREIPNIQNANLFWLIDPIDGTRSFLKNRDSFTVNIALIENNRPILGFIYLPSSHKLYYTNENDALAIEENGKKIEPRLHDQNGLVAVVSSHITNNETEDYLAKYDFDEILSIPSSIKLCMVAEGQADIYPKFSDTMEWDIAAGDALIRAAGGRVTSIEGDDLLYGKTNFLNHHFLAMGRRWVG
jgi:3'(2'), 5'-bisphosphate nucleotidase